MQEDNVDLRKSSEPIQNTVHPSLYAEFDSPPPLEPRIKMPVNEKCWCGSGKKWKKCHRDRKNQKPVHVYELFEEQRVEMEIGYCLHPNASSDTCSPKIIHAHTIQRKSSLDAIAENGHVFSPYAGLMDIPKNNGRIIPRKAGIKAASTFMGFCAFHDNQLFSPIEKSVFITDKEAFFLLSYRAICYELFNKNMALRSVEITRQSDKGKPFEIVTF